MSNKNTKPQSQPQKPVKPDNTREKSEDFTPKPSTTKK